MTKFSNINSIKKERLFWLTLRVQAIMGPGERLGAASRSTYWQMRKLRRDRQGLGVILLQGPASVTNLFQQGSTSQRFQNLLPAGGVEEWGHFRFRG